MERRDGTLKRLLVGLVASVLLLDVLYTATTNPGTTGTTFRVMLAAGAGLTVPLAIGIGLLDRTAYAVGTLLLLPFVALYIVTGLLLPWDHVAYVTGQSTLEALLVVPVVGEPLATTLFGGFTSPVSRSNVRPGSTVGSSS